MGRLFSSDDDYRRALGWAPGEDGYSTSASAAKQRAATHRQDAARSKVARVLRALFHRHAFEAVSAYRLPTITNFSDSTADVKMFAEIKRRLLLQGIDISRTQILWRCRCGRVKVETVAGSWRLEEIRGDMLYARSED